MNSDFLNALLNAQQAMPGVGKEGFNPHYKSKYATLEGTYATIVPVLNSHGIVYLESFDVNEDGKTLLISTLAHVDTAETITSRYPIIQDKPGPQPLGSGTTYARRYALLALGMSCPVDDDGEGAMARKTQEPVKSLSDGQTDTAMSVAVPTTGEWPDSRNEDGATLLATLAAQFSSRQDDVSRLISWFEDQNQTSGDKRWSTVSKKKDGSAGAGQYGLAVWKLDDRYGKESHRYILSALSQKVVDKDNPETVPGWKAKDLIDWLMAPDENQIKLATLDNLAAELKADMGIGS